jgi:hypothetical protein
MIYLAVCIAADIFGRFPCRSGFLFSLMSIDPPYFLCLNRVKLVDPGMSP